MPLDHFRYSFDKRVRNGADNPTIVDMARVKCPAELVELTQGSSTFYNSFGYSEQNYFCCFCFGKPTLFILIFCCILPKPD